MNHRIAFLACCVAVACLPTTARAADVPSGIYRVVPDGQGTRVARSTGGTIDLGERLSENFGDVTIWSLSNQNDQFQVSMQHAGPVDAKGRLAIVANGVCEVVGGHSEADESGRRHLSSLVTGHANAEKLAAGMAVKLQERKHPGHALSVLWKPVKDIYKVGEPVILEVTIENVGPTTIRFVEGGKQRGARDNQFAFIAFAGSGHGKPIPDTGDPTNFGGIGGFRELKPGGVFHKQVDITKWFKFEKPDSYQITAIYELPLQDEGFGAPLLWEDFATGRCTVRIGE